MSADDVRLSARGEAWVRLSEVEPAMHKAEAAQAEEIERLTLRLGEVAAYLLIFRGDFGAWVNGEGRSYDEVMTDVDQAINRAMHLDEEHQHEQDG